MTRLIALAALLLLAPLAAGDDAPHPSLLTLDAIFTAGTYDQESVPAIHWDAEGHTYTTLEEIVGNPLDDQLDETDDADTTYNIVRHDPATGEKTILATPADLTPPGATKPLAIDAFSLSDDGRKLLVYTDSKRVWRRNSRGDYYVLHLKSKTLTRLGGDAAVGDPSTLKYAQFSPDSHHVAYVQHNNLFTQSLKDFTITQLTHDGSPTLINGTFDWVYEEEFGRHRGFVWSPDSKHLAYWQIDDSRVGQFSMIDYTSDLYPKLTTFAYPKVGETNPAARAFIVPTTGGRAVPVKLPGDPRDHYITRLRWTGEPKRLVARQLDRAQDNARLFSVNPRNGRARRFFTDTQSTWFDDRFDARPALGRDAFLWLTEHDGWKRPLLVSDDGKSVTPLVTAPLDTIAVAALTETHLYFTASPDDPVRRYLYRVTLDGGDGRTPERLTPDSLPGTNSYSISPDGQFAIHRHSTFDQPTTTTLIKLPSHETVATLEDNADLREKLTALDSQSSEFLRIPLAGTDIGLDAWCLKPHDFDPSKKYPAIVYVYGEPAGATVRDSWGRKTHLFHHYMAQRGFVVLSIDNRGTPAPRGTAFRHHANHQIGIAAPTDQANALRHLLETRPYIDPQRIGVWGHSGGGSMTLNAMFRHPDLYRAGVALAFIADQKLYDTIYQERYMGVPPDNEDNYVEGSPITHAHKLEGDLLLIYGTGDDNCHYQNCERLIDKLVEHNKPFELLSYPNRTHAIKEGKITILHRYSATAAFFERTLRLL